MKMLLPVGLSPVFQNLSLALSLSLTRSLFLLSHSFSLILTLYLRLEDFLCMQNTSKCYFSVSAFSVCHKTEIARTHVQACYTSITCDG